jgi:hypothetical protein
MKELQEKNNELESTLSILAEKEFNAKKEALTKRGYDTSDISTPEQLKALELASRRVGDKKQAGHSDPEDTPYWNPDEKAPRAKVDLREFTVESPEEAISFLDYVRKNDPERRAEAEQILSEMLRKTLKDGKIDLTYEGSIKNLANRPIRFKDDTDEQFAERVKKWKSERTKWKRS